MKVTSRSKGLIWSFFGVLILSPDALLIRLVDLGDFTLIFYRGIFPPITIILFLIYFYKGNFLRSFFNMGIAGIVYAILYSIIHMTFVFSIQLTSVANTLVLIASAPIFAAILSLIFLKERPKTFTWVVIFFAFVSMIIIGWGSYTTTGFLGDFFALLTGLGMAASTILARFYKKKDFVPACFIGCLLTAIYSFPLIEDLTINTSQMINLSIMCFIILPIPFMIITITPRFAPSYEVALIFLLESVLGTLWVWLAINEEPSINTLVGGIMLLASVFIFIYISAKEESRSIT